MISTPEQISCEKKTYRSVWISDVHIGTRHAQVDALLDFLKQIECQYLYLVGDIIDGWQLKSKWHWRDDYNVFIQKLLRKSRKDTQIIYITGNHDEFLEKFININFGGISLAREVIHTAADGKRYLVLHGHQFDGLTQFNRVLEKVGTKLYDWILDFNLHFNRLRRRLGFGYWSLAGYLKYKAKSAVKYITEYEEAMIHMAHKHNVQGVICGHIHRAEMKMMGKVAYLNCGDWVESCTALVEDFDGNIQLIKLHENNAQHTRRGPGSYDSGDGGETDPGTVGTPDHERGGWPGRSPADSGILCIGHEDASAPDYDSGFFL
ncbi:metallophosphoesterase [Pedosphaera parvula Ellin514]|uniref:Metallophosphoesterase n=1 Tax=Pedosphaera parvula (strain Ellin514) TaxID=320771 RepID=B9XR95_PEDPL|nr:metallophosphoesterase [Pedosphaera parvula Ellin514]